jgi:hypothetical protein
MFIRSGVTRHVLITKNYAFKVPNVRNGWRLFLCGLLANLSEKEWGNYQDASLKPNTPLFSSWGGWLSVQRRAEPFTGDISTLNWLPWGDRKQSNLGIVNGQVVVIDYDMHGRAPGAWAMRHDRCCDLGCDGCCPEHA